VLVGVEINPWVGDDQRIDDAVHQPGVKATPRAPSPPGALVDPPFQVSPPRPLHIRASASQRATRDTLWSKARRRRCRWTSLLDPIPVDVAPLPASRRVRIGRELPGAPLCTPGPRLTAPCFGRRQLLGGAENPGSSPGRCRTRGGAVMAEDLAFACAGHVRTRRPSWRRGTTRRAARRHGTRRRRDDARRQRHVGVGLADSRCGPSPPRRSSVLAWATSARRRYSSSGCPGSAPGVDDRWPDPVGIRS